MTTVYLMRHGEAENPEKIIYGRREGFPLSEIGREQAKAAREFFADKNLAAVFSSPITRCLETARIISNVVKVDDRLIEMKNYYEGIKIAKYDEMFSNKSVYDDPIQIKFGETAQQIYDRTKGCLDEKIKMYTGQNFILVSHADPIMILKYGLEGREYNHYYKIPDEYIQKGKWFVVQHIDNLYKIS